SEQTDGLFAAARELGVAIFETSVEGVHQPLILKLARCQFAGGALRQPRPAVQLLHDAMAQNDLEPRPIGLVLGQRRRRLDESVAVADVVVLHVPAAEALVRIEARAALEKYFAFAVRLT